MILSQDFLSLPLLYHLNSTARTDDEVTLEESFPFQYVHGSAGKVPLPLQPFVGSLAVVRLLRERASCRNFVPRRLTGQHLAALLLAAGGVVGISEAFPGIYMARRSTPSAGGLYPVATYVLTHSVDHLDDGVYRFDPISHTMEMEQQGSFRQRLRDLLLGQQYFDHANVVFILTATFAVATSKYGPRGYRYILLEAGHAAQNICLLATELGLGSLCVGGFDDVEMNSFLGLDPIEQAALYCVGCGHTAE